MNIKMLLLASMLVAPGVYAECTMPDKPPVPDGATSTEVQMVDGQSRVKAFVEAAEAYIACLDQEARQAGDTDTPEAAAARVAAHNNAVDQMTAVADSFNSEIREWKAAAGQAAE